MKKFAGGYSLLTFGISFLCLQQVVHTYPHDGRLGIYNGYEVEPHSIPFQAFLVVYYDGSPVLCGGSLISENYVLTVAHCIKGGDYAEVYLGVHNRSNLDENVQIFNSTELYPHENYGFNGSKLINDIGLIKLPNPVKITSAVQIGKIISRSDYQENPNQIGINATVSGWGKIGNPGTYADVLLAGLLHIVVPSYCESSSSYTPDQFLCIPISSSGKDPESASGDSGGPLFKHSDGDQIIVGLVSLGDENIEAETNIGYYQDWIAEHSDVIF